MEQTNELVKIIENISETTPLLNFAAPRDTLSVKVANTIGSITTFMAMVPQGILGVLLTDKILLGLNQEFNNRNIPLLIVRIGIDGLVFITAEEGKRRLVRYFNTETFKNFGRKQWWKSTFLTPWSMTDVIAFVGNAAFTLVASGVFVGLAAISFDGIADLLLAYKSPITDKISTWVRSYIFKAPFMLATLLCNLPFFPTAHKMAFRLLADAGYYIIENPEFRSYKQSIISKLHAAQSLWKYINEANDETQKIDFLNTYNTVNEKSSTEKLIQIGQQSNIEIKAEAWPEFFTKHSAAISLTGLGILGLYNFLTMTDKVAAMFRIEQAAPVLRWMDYVSMSAVAFGAIYPMALAVINQCFGRNYRINLIPTASYLWILISAFFVCLLGGAPNAYQSILASESLIMVLIAAIDSLMIEVYGYYQLTKNKKIASLCNDNSTNTQAYAIDSELEETIMHIENLSSLETIKLNFENQPSIPRYRPIYTSLKNNIQRCFFNPSQATTLNINQADYEDIEEQKLSHVRLN